MSDTSFKAFLLVAGLLVVMPGSTMVVVADVALAHGRAAALMTVAGVNIANSTLALASALGLSAALHRWPALIGVLSLAGAAYLTFLGARTLWRTLLAVRPSTIPRAA